MPSPSSSCACLRAACSSSKQMKKYKMIIDSQWMKWYLNQPKSEGDSIFYQTNVFNKSTQLVNWQSKPVKKCNRFYPIRKCGCFPSEAPITSYPMRHRAVGARRPLGEKEIVRPIVTDRKNLMKNFTFKLQPRKKSE